MGKSEEKVTEILGGSVKQLLAFIFNSTEDLLIAYYSQTSSQHDTSTSKFQVRQKDL
jgi:hypothetical protein